MRLTLSQEEARRRDAEYREWLTAFTSQVRTPTADLVPSRKLERRRTVEQRQKELEEEFSARFPALYKKAQSMRSASHTDSQPPPSWSPPPPRFSQSFRNVDWAAAGPASAAAGTSDDAANYDRKAPLVAPLASALDKMREASGGSDSGTSLKGRSQSCAATAAAAAAAAEEYEHDYDEIDPNSEGLGNDPVFQKAGLPSSSSSLVAAAGQDEIGGSTGSLTKAGGGGEKGEELKKVVRKRPTQIWERLRGK
jgi:hypothetical protein